MKPQVPRLRTAALLVATAGVAALAVARPLSPSEATATPATRPARFVDHANHAAMSAGGATVSVTIREWQVTSSARTIPSGRVTFTVRNAGKKPHEFKVVKARGAAVKGFAMKHDRAVLSGVRGALRPLRPGEARRLTVTLPRGRYVLMCTLAGHYRRARIPLLGVKTAAGKTPAPEGRVTIVLTNTEALPHNVAIKGNGVDAKGPEVGQGKTSSVSADLAPGVYIFYCSVSGHEAAA